MSSPALYVVHALAEELEKRGGSERVSSVAGILSQLSSSCIEHVRAAGGIYHFFRNHPSLFELESCVGRSAAGRKVAFKRVTLLSPSSSSQGAVTPSERLTRRHSPSLSVPRDSAKRTSSAGLKDWDCAQCSYSNFRKRTSCRLCGAGGGIARPLSLSPASSPEQERTTRKRLAISPVVSKTMDAWRDEASDDKTFDDAFPAIEIQDRTSRKKRVAISPIVDDVCAIEIPKPTRAVVVDGDNAEAELDRNFDLLVERLARLLAPPPRARASLLAAVDTDGWTSPGFGCAAPPPLVRRNGPPSWRQSIAPPGWAPASEGAAWLQRNATWDVGMKKSAARHLNSYAGRQPIATQGWASASEDQECGDAGADEGWLQRESLFDATWTQDPGVGCQRTAGLHAGSW